jgi:predicted nucleic acid-binding protein
MEVTASSVRRWLLLDKSALVRGPEIDETLGEPCLCAITRLEVLYSARSDSAYEALEAELDAFHHLRVDAETIDAAVTAQRELAAQSQHRVAIPDLLIAACAQQHQAAVLHVDRHYDTLARVLAFTPVRLVT